MTASTRIAAEPRYWITRRGSEDRTELETCACSQLFVCDGVYQCLVCQTIYGVVFGWSVPPRKLRRRAEGAA